MSEQRPALDRKAAMALVLRAVMISMSMTGSGVYSHDDYDEAHRALNWLSAEAERVSVLEAQLAELAALSWDVVNLATKGQRKGWAPLMDLHAWLTALAASAGTGGAAEPPEGDA